MGDFGQKKSNGINTTEHLQLLFMTLGFFVIQASRKKYILNVSCNFHVSVSRLDPEKLFRGSFSSGGSSYPKEITYFSPMEDIPL